MRVGLQLPYFKYQGGTPAIAPKLRDVAQVADEGGFYSIWVMDHFFQLGHWLGEASDPMLEGYSVLNFLAGITENVKLGTLVTGVVYRHPGQLIKAVTTLDVLSGGRAYLGIGAAWYEEEALSLGIPYPETKVRFEILEETLQFAHQMWDESKNGAFEGKHIHATATINHPQALSQPHPPILIGGMGANKTLRMVAQYADACNFFYGRGVGQMQEAIDNLKRHCDDLGRDYNEIEKSSLDTSMIGTGEESPQDVINRCKELADLGFSHVIFNHMGFDNLLQTVETFAKEIVPAVADL